MEILEPIDQLGEWMKAFPKLDGESAQPQQLDDEPQKVAGMLGRQNASYDAIWAKAMEVSPKWVPVRCNSLRRAVLLASSATQHRTRVFEVYRRGRLVVLRYIPTEKSVEEPVQSVVNA